ncbi:MAG: hypothetical protein L0312_10100 [Acidobacteria bacterium]|nr:hypothetical protein [Acidobacteriota bacterium]
MPQEEWQRAPKLERGRKSPNPRWAGAAAACALFGEINDSQQEAWWRTIEVLENGQAKPQQVSLLAEDRRVPSQWHEVIHVKVNQMRLEIDQRNIPILAQRLQEAGYNVSDPDNHANECWGWTAD